VVQHVDSFMVRWEEPAKLSTHAFGAHVCALPACSAA
jgi:hypothetical protein